MIEERRRDEQHDHAAQHRPCAALIALAHTSSGAEELAKMIPKARVVAAFTTVPSEVLFGVYEANRETSRPSLVYCGDDESGKRVAAELIRDVGFDPVDAGPYGSPDTSSRSRCSSPSSRTGEQVARNWLTGSTGTGLQVRPA